MITKILTTMAIMNLAFIRMFRLLIPCRQILFLIDQMFLEQVKPNGRPLGLEPAILLVPPALRVSADQLMTSVKLNETTTANKPKPVDNTFAGKFRVEHSAYLSNATVHTNASNKAWYLLAPVPT